MSYVINAALPYLVDFIAKNEDTVSKKITEALTLLKEKDAEKAVIFKSKWNLLNEAVQKSLEDVTASAPTGGKRTRRRRRKHRK